MKKCALCANRRIAPEIMSKQTYRNSYLIKTNLSDVCTEHYIKLAIEVYKHKIHN